MCVRTVILWLVYCNNFSSYQRSFSKNSFHSYSLRIHGNQSYSDSRNTFFAIITHRYWQREKQRSRQIPCRYHRNDCLLQVQSRSVCDLCSCAQHGRVCQISNPLLRLHSWHPTWLRCSSLPEHYHTNPHDLSSDCSRKYDQEVAGSKPHGGKSSMCVTAVCVSVHQWIAVRYCCIIILGKLVAQTLVSRHQATAKVTGDSGREVAHCR